MIKLTLGDGGTFWIKPDVILGVKDWHVKDHGKALVMVPTGQPGTALEYLVKETAQEVMDLINKE